MKPLTTPAPINDLHDIARVLGAARTVAVVGASPNPSRPSHGITRYLIEAGFEVYPVNPEAAKVLGRRSYPDLASIPAEVRIDVVDVFRRSDAVSEIADAAIARGVGFFFMQDGVVDAASAKRLSEAGIGVAMDRCIYRDLESIRQGGSVGR